MVKQLFVEGCCQELKFTVYETKNLISNVLQHMFEQEYSSKFVDTDSN